jgi:hypothetical protein
MNETTRSRTANEAEALRLWNSLSERNKGIAMVLMETVGTLAVNIARMEAIAGSETPDKAERSTRT